MAKKRKRLNKKVALIGSLVLAVFLLGVVVVVLRFSKDPQKFLADAEAALAQKDYEATDRNYRQAYGCAKDDDLKIEILFKMADLHLIDDEVQEDESVIDDEVQGHEPDWRKAIGCWNTAINIDPKNTKARMFLLKYFYETGDSGNPGVWQTVESTASELAQVIDEKLEKPDTYVLLVKARAKLEIADLGQTSDREKTLAEAVAELEQLKELAPENIDIYKYLARAETIQGEIDNLKGVPDAARKAAEKAEEILQRAVDMSPDNPETYINLLDTKLKSAWGEVGTDWRESEKVQAIQKEFESLVHKFGSNAKAYASLARFYQLDVKGIDKAVEAIEKAVELDSQDINHMMIMAELYYRKFSIYGDEQFFTKALETANNALNLPGARDVQGPRQFRHRQYRYVLFTQLADWYVEQAFEAGLEGDEQEKAQWTRKAEEAIHEIEQFLGTGDNVYILKWHGLLALIKGDTTTAIRQMFTACEQLKAANQRDMRLSYMLARVFEDRAEIGARQEFLENALLKRPSIALQKPEALLDYAEVLLQLRAKAQAIMVVDAYEKSGSVSDRSKRVRIRTYIQAGQFDDAEAYLVQMEPDAVDTIEMRISLVRSRINRITASRRKQEDNLDEQQQAAESRERPVLVAYRRRLNNLRRQLLEKKPEQLGVVLALCSDYVTDGQIEQARSTIDKYLAHSPDNTSAQFYKRTLSEPDPAAISQDRLNEMSEEIIANIPDELERSIKLGQHYQSLGLLEKAMAEYKKAYAKSPDEKGVVALLFDVALLSEDMVLAEELVQQARSRNLDECEGNLFAARFDMVKGDSQNALSRLNDSLKARPVFANGYLWRSQVNGNLGNYEETVSDVKMAQRFNPLDKVIAKQMAAVLYNRSLRLGTKVSSEQIAETERALGKAILLNMDDWNLRSIYAEYISEREPANALAARQRLVKRFPNVDNNLMLGNMAMRMAVKETDEERRKGLLDIAREGYVKAYEMAPTEKRVLDGYSEYLRMTGQGDKAKGLFEGKDDSLWRYYLRDGQYDMAGDILGKIYKDEPENVTVVRSLSLVASKTEDKEALKKYSQELLALENTPQNQLMQIQSYLEVGLVKEAELKLESFRERYPDEPKGMMLEAWSAMTKGQLKRALEYVNQNLEINPENSVAWRLRGQINRLLGEFDQAVEDLQKSKSIDTNPRIRMELATVYRRIGRVTAAIGELTAALKNQQAPPRVRTMLEQLYLQAGRKTDLKQFYDETLQKYPDSGLWHFRAGKFAMQEKQYEQAEQLLKRSWEISEEQGGYIPALDKYLEVLWSSQKYKELLKYAAKYIDAKSAPIAYAQMAQARFMMGSKATAMDYYRKAIEKCGTDDGLIIGILQNMSNIIGPMEVVGWCNEKLQASPDSLAANLMMFNLSRQRGEYNKALGYIDKFLSLVDPDSPAWIEQMLHKANTLTMAYMKTSNKQYFSIAVEEFEKILEKQKNNTSVLNNIAYFLADNNEQLDKALEYAKRAHETSPNDGNIMDTYAYTLCKVGDYAKAGEVLQMAIQIFERESAAVTWDVYKHLGMAQEGLGQKAAACESYRQALQVGGRKISKQNREELTKAIERVCG